MPKGSGAAGARVSSAYADTLAAWQAGARTPQALAKALVIDYDTAKKRLQRYREQLGEETPS